MEIFPFLAQDETIEEIHDSLNSFLESEKWLQFVSSINNHQTSFSDFHINDNENLIQNLYQKIKNGYISPTFVFESYEPSLLVTKYIQNPDPSFFRFALQLYSEQNVSVSPFLNLLISRAPNLILTIFRSFDSNSQLLSSFSHLLISSSISSHSKRFFNSLASLPPDIIYPQIII